MSQYIEQNGRFKAQIHFHTNQDHSDKFIDYSPKQAIDKAKEYNYRFLSFTHHKRYWFSSEIQKYALWKGIILIKGAELRIKGQDVLVYNGDKKIEQIKNFEDLKQYRINNPKVVVVAPHPFYPWPCLRKNLEENINLFDGIEYCWFYNRFYNKFNKKAEIVATNNNKFLLGTSDVHYLKFINKTFSWVKVDIDFDNLFYQNINQYIDLFWENVKNNQLKLYTKTVGLYDFSKMVISMFRESR